eukprot:CAMPEP_0115390374 /NCGR_PEP_ID=MMETSP0271-20121206/10169_1 /TAXON_ID=71861 /ORGANISM="Scrippsiella trochoidea, Strain CCMP3099" /LENGTH=436 /DNA_ID=CAMNT_0002813915 /DNA_START=88 /DNA_END=1398 /DNA_ORIENTATION=-
MPCITGIATVRFELSKPLRPPAASLQAAPARPDSFARQCGLGSSFGCTAHGILVAAGSTTLAHRTVRSRAGRCRRAPSMARVACAAVSSGEEQPDEGVSSEAVRQLLLYGSGSVQVMTRPSSIAEQACRVGDTHSPVGSAKPAEAQAKNMESRCENEIPREGATTGRARTELMALQGYWEEIKSGLTVRVVNDEVDFHDGKGMRKFTEAPDGLWMKQVRLVGGLPDLALWRRADGMEMVWARAPHIEDDPTFHATFYQYKLRRTLLRAKLVRALRKEDYRAAAKIQKAWQSAWGAGEDVTPQQELRLARGRFLVPGACVRHSVFNFRAVILGCEPWIRAPLLKMNSTGKRASSNSPQDRLQPVYCCLVDERDAPGGGVTYALEDDLYIASDVYPLQGRFVERMLREHECIQGYLPGSTLGVSRKRQSRGLPFILSN